MDAATGLVRGSLAAVAACQSRLARGTLPDGTDCVADSAARRSAAGGRLAARIRHACTGQAYFTPAGDCANVGTPETLAACVQATHDAGAIALGHVFDATTGKLSSAARRCQTAASRAVRDFTLARLRILQRCKRRPPMALAPGTVCGADAATSARLTALRAHAGRSITARCTGDALAGARFGAPCAAPASGEPLAQCLLAAGETTGDAALAAEFPNPGFCGDGGAAVERRIDKLLAEMTRADKIEQMHGAGLAGVSHTAANAGLGIPGLVMVDGPRGIGFTVGAATSFPVGIARGATWDVALEEQVGDAFGAEARAKGVSMLLAPTMNMLHHPRWGRAQETYGEDTVHLGRMATAFIRGVQRHVIASAKHFAGNSIEGRGADIAHSRFNVDVSVDERTLREVYLPHFRMAVQEGHTGSVMSAYNQVNGQYCGENVHLLHDVLKGDWGFQGFVESDWVFGTRSTVPSATAGLDIEMPAANYYGKPLADAVGAGQVPEATIDAAVRRILRAQLCFRLDTDPPAADPTQVETPAHASLALQVAREGIVLLKNEHGTLPLDRSHLTSIVVVGARPVQRNPGDPPAEPPLAATANLGDHGSSTVVPSHAVAPLDGIVARAGGVTVTHVLGDPLTPADQTAIATADAAVIIAGLTFLDEGEGQITVGDRTSLALPGNQDALIAAVAALNPRTIVVLEGSGPVTMPWIDTVPALLTAWYPGQEGGTAIAEVLFGDLNPSGKLPLSFPRAEFDLPPFDAGNPAVTYGYYHGYRYLDKNGTAPLFPFGFGLSYTTFRYANLTVGAPTLSPYGRLTVTADVTNTGALPGDEVAQLYVGYRSSRVDRAVHDLKAFARVHLDPGETKTVSFPLRAADLAFWDTAAGGWEVEAITYDVAVGSSSRDLPLAGSFAVTP